jgi:hypothetical protein
MEYTEDNRPLTNQVLCHQLAVWIALDCVPQKFNKDLLCNMFGTYFKLTKKLNKPKQEALSNKQLSILYNIYDKYKVKDVFQFHTLKFICVDMSRFEALEVVSQSNLKCECFYFETKEEGVLTTEEFITRYRDKISHPNYITKLKASMDEDFC